MWGSFTSVFGLVSSLFHIFVTQPRLLSSIPIPVNKELFHQSSFYLSNLFCIFLGGKGWGRNVQRKCPRPLLISPSITYISRGLKLPNRNRQLYRTTERMPWHNEDPLTNSATVCTLTAPVQSQDKGGGRRYWSFLPHSVVKPQLTNWPTTWQEGTWGLSYR